MSRIMLEDFDKEERDIKPINKEFALKIIRQLCMGKEQLLLSIQRDSGENLGVKPNKELLKQKISDRVLYDGIKIIDMTDEEAIEYLTTNFYNTSL